MYFQQHLKELDDRLVEQLKGRETHPAFNALLQNFDHLLQVWAFLTHGPIYFLLFDQSQLESFGVFLHVFSADVEFLLG